MTYALGTAGTSGPSHEVAAKKPLSIFRTKKTSVRSTSSESPSHQARYVVGTRAEVARREAFEKMFLASRPKFVAMARAIVRNKEDAEDAVQNAFLSGYRHLRSFEGRSALKTWFTRIVMNAALMIQRKRKPFTIEPLRGNSNAHGVGWTETIPASQPDPEMLQAEREMLQLIDGILGKMKPVLRQAFTMTYFDELSGPEACAILGVSVGTFKARLFRAKRQVFGQTKRALWLPWSRRSFRRPNS